MRFWGWGEDAHAGEGLPPHAEEMLRRELDLPAVPIRRPVALADVPLRKPALLKRAAAALAAGVGAEHVRDDREARVLHAAGKSYPDLVRQRAGNPAAPGAR